MGKRTGIGFIAMTTLAMAVAAFAVGSVRMAQAAPPDPCFGECDWWAVQNGDRSHVARPVFTAAGSEDGNYASH